MIFSELFQIYLTKMNVPRKSFFQRFVEQLNFIKLFRDSLVFGSVRAGFAVTTITFSQLMPPDVTTMKVKYDLFYQHGDN
jgi:hypothetical protein